MNNLPRRILSIIVLLLTAQGFAVAGEQEVLNNPKGTVPFSLSTIAPRWCPKSGQSPLDWSVWRYLPVFEAGRIMPLDTFARQTVEGICGRVHPTFSLAGTSFNENPSSPEYADAQKIFPAGAPRKFAPEELLLSWLVEPDKWESVPFLRAENEQLRREVLDLPLVDGQGRRLRYASPWQVENCPQLGRRWAELQVQAKAEGERFKPLGVDKSVKELIEAYVRYRALIYSPQASGEMPRRFYERLSSTGEAWKKLAADIKHSSDLNSDNEIVQAIKDLNETLPKLIVAAHGDQFDLEKIEPAAGLFHEATDKLADILLKKGDKVRASLAVDLMHEAYEMHASLYDDGDQLRLAPALSAGALEENRTPEDDAQPWLALQTLLLGSDSLMRPYPQAALRQVRQSFDRLATAYTDRANPRRSEEFLGAMDQFARSLREFAGQVEPLREKLPILHRSDNLLAATAYPGEGFCGMEVFYNSLDPFFWSWLLSLIALVFLVLAVGMFRKPFFWLGAAVLAAGQAITICGFALRGYITGLVPLTGMFETTVFVALFVAVLGLWFALLPITWPGWQLAWQLTALPKKIHYLARRIKADVNQTLQGGHSWIEKVRWCNLLFRVGITYWLFVKLIIFSGRPGQGYFNLLPKINLGESLPTISSLIVWLVGGSVLLIGLYCLPRLIPAVAISLFTIPYMMCGQDWREAIGRVLERKAFVLVGAAVCLLTALIAYFAPPEIMRRGLDSPRPILRDNFWLFVHVLTIMASYGAGALAWGLGNIALRYYLLGHYSGNALVRRAPEICDTLANFIYKVMQVAVLLLVAGTILGALWADVAWGRFWGWDPKEVWALVSLLVYMAVLHARRAGWTGNFGLAVGSVLGATAILMAWYGVNFLLGSGLHSYASGAGGQFEVGTAVVLNWLFVIAAAVRYRLEIYPVR